MVKYWFEKWNVICRLNADGSYTVINGGWTFTIDDKGLRYFEHTKELVSPVRDKPIAVTEEQFRELQPNFGYW